MLKSGGRAVLLFAISVFLLLQAGLTAQTSTQPQAPPQVQALAIANESLPSGLTGQAYKTQLAGAGGVPPYTWALDPQSKLPPGLTLEKNGSIAGVPTTPGEYRFVVELRDAAPEMRVVKKQFTVVISAAFTIEWRKSPTVEQGGINGAVIVTNETADDLDLTVIVMAVNEIGKAFALGYEHFALPARKRTPVIPFNSTLPFGRYVVHADAIGEATATGRISRSRLQTASPFIIAQP
jgi:hypothetical protein